MPTLDTSLDRDAVRSLVAFDDPLGVLSLYAHVQPGSRRGAPASRIEIDNRLRAIRAEASAAESRDRRRGIPARLDALAPDIDAILDESAPGCGRVLFAALERGERRTFAFQLPVDTHAVVGSSAAVLPLVDVAHRGRPAAILSISRSEVTLLRWSLGLVEQVSRWTLDLDTGEWSELRGPAAASPALAQTSSSQRDRFDELVLEQQIRFAVAHAGDVARMGAAEGWDVLVLAGDPRLTGPFAQALPPGGPHVLRVDRRLRSVPPHEAARMVLPDIEGHRAGSDADLVASVRETAGAGGRAVVGLEETLAALNEDRVSCLVIRPDARLVGARASDGRLFASVLQARTSGAGDLEPEERLAEIMVERALAGSADVVPASGEAADALQDVEGVAAFLRR